MPSKVTLMFEMGKFGWSEIYWNSASNTDGSLPAVITELVDSRRQALPSAARHVFTRVSNPDLRGSVLPMPAQGAGTASWSSTVDWAWNAILFQEASASLSVKGRIFLRPGPETPTGAQVPDTTVVPPAVVASLGQLITRLTFPGTGWVVRGLSSLRPEVRIMSGGTTPISANFSTFEPHGIQPGERFRISGIKDDTSGRCINGIYIAQTVPTPTTLTFSVPPGPTVTYGAQGFIRGQVYVYEPITVAGPLRIVSRRTGRPFGLSRGRSSNQKRCCPLPAPSALAEG